MIREILKRKMQPLKDAEDLNLKTDDAVFLKYDISVEDKRCGDPLDPYFIVRK